MSRTTRFASGSNSYRSNSPLTDDVIRRVAPSVFATEPHSSRSARYSYIPTSMILAGLRKEGFQPFFACQSRTRVEDKAPYTKHMLRLRHADTIMSDRANEIILINSHDGTSREQLMAGTIVSVCMNGLICGDNIETEKVYHKGDIVSDVIEGAYRMVDRFKLVDENVLEMKAIGMSEEETQVFAAAALSLKYDEEAKVPVTVNQILTPRRHEDANDSLWSTFNRVQEHLVTGGDRGITPTGRNTRTRPVAGIDNNVRLNRALWMLAEGMRNLKAA